MGTIGVHEFITLDGVMDNPSWTFQFPFEPRMGVAIGELTGRSRAILLGRRTYEMFAPVWSQRTAEDDPGAPFFNDTPKYVVSSTLRDPEWGDTTVLGPYRADAVRELKERVDGGIYVSGSATLVRALIADGPRWRCARACACSPRAGSRRRSRSPGASATTTAWCT